MEEESISITNADCVFTSVTEQEDSERSDLTVSMVNDTSQLQNDSELVTDIKEEKPDEPSNSDNNAPIPTNNNTILDNNNIGEVHSNNNPPDKTCESSRQKSARRNGKRSVTFPDDKSLVIGFLEPCNPWKNAPICTAEELVEAYKKGCELYDVKPWNKIIDQLSKVKNCWNRHKSFVLEGKQLEYKHCEALEEVFRRVQFESIILQICDLEDGTAEALFDMIEYYDSTMKLNMSFNNEIGITGLLACSNMIRKTPSLHYLDARGCQLNDRIITIFGRSLKLGSNLTILHLENTSITENCLLVLVEALKKNEVLQELYLGDNKLGPKSGKDVGNLLKFNSRLQLLDLRNNQLQNAGLKEICHGLCQKVSPHGINTLVLWNNQITHLGMSYLSDTLAKVECLETLNLGNNNITNEGIHYLKDGLLKSKSLMRLGLQNTKISCEVELLKKNEVLQELFLGDNKLGPNSGNDIGNLLKFNSNLQLLDLRNNQLQDAGLNKICQGLCQKISPHGINTLVLWNNQLTHLGMPYLADALAQIECLETLNLGNNSITNEGIRYLKDGLLKSKSLIRLGLQNTKILCEGAVALAEYIADSSHIVHIDLSKNNIRTAGLMALSLASKVNRSLVRLDLDKTTKKEAAVKDYADQQQRLLSDISNYLERNNTLAVQKKNEQLKEAEEFAKKQEAEMVALQQKEELESLESAYFPTCDKIRRPTLLFATEPSPQTTLDSPAVITQAEFTSPIESPLVSSVSPMSFQTPPGDFLLSPQYCENTKAKKIFSVTKVGDMSPSFQLSSPTSLPVSPPTLGLPSPNSVDQVMLNFDPNHSSKEVYTNEFSKASEICKDIAAETFSGLFGINVKDTNLTNGNANNKGFVLLSPSEKISPNVNNAENSSNRTDNHMDPALDSSNYINESNSNIVSNLNNKTEYLGRDSNSNSNKTSCTGDSAASSSYISADINNCHIKNSSNKENKTTEFRVQSCDDLTPDITTILNNLELNSNMKSEKSNQHFQTDVISTPEEYEKELDVMLAQVQKDHNIISQ
ncbi:protein phosphatase 1 regulatory subunit 37-like isoform X1 [Argonauta hians]